MAELVDRIGAYQIVGRLGGGAMGTVHLARSPGGRLVAVKVVRPDLAEDARFRERFRREIAMARAVGGFWTAAVVDADPDAERPWLATEYVPGPDLHEAVRSTGALPQDAVRGLAAGLAEALAAIHAAGLVHRDLKPSNVLLAADGPRVIDFGISKALEGDGLTATGMVVGTPGYLSPEQIEGREVGPASDVFAFGAVVVFAASGRNPFGEGDTAALLYRAVHTRPDLRDVPHDLRDLVSRCLERKAALRPSAPELVAALGGRAAGEWLPPAVRTLIDQRHTEIVTARPPTRVLPQDIPYAGPSDRVRWWLERGEHPEPRGGGQSRRRGRKATDAAGQAAQGQAVQEQGQPAPDTQAPPAPGFPAPLADHPQAHAPAPGHAPPAAPLPGQAASAGPLPGKDARSAVPAAPSTSASGPMAPPVGSPASSPGISSVAVRAGLSRWWAKALGWVQQAPAAAPAPKPAEQLAERVNRLVEQAREAMSEGERPKNAPERRAKTTPRTKGKAAPATKGKAKAAPNTRGKAEVTPKPQGGGNQAVFATARGPYVVAAGVGAGGAVLLLAAAAEAGKTGQPAIALIVFVLAVLLALVALRRAGQAVVRRRAAEVTAGGLSWRRGATVTTLKWSRVARVRVVEDKSRAWLVVWPRDPAALPGKPDHHGGYKVFPIGHDRRAATRDREVRELRAALTWYGRSAYDPSP
ncbi:serine/threonine-protein kinase [Actinokineospora sp. 24-640]